MYTRINDSPHFVPRNYLEEFSKPCEPEKPKPDLEMECQGTGISPEEHPMKDRINFHPCANCKSENIKIIYAHWCVSPNSGDSYWDYEALCENCGKYISVSFSEN